LKNERGGKMGWEERVRGYEIVAKKGISACLINRVF